MSERLNKARAFLKEHSGLSPATVTIIEEMIWAVLQKSKIHFEMPDYPGPSYPQGYQQGDEAHFPQYPSDIYRDKRQGLHDYLTMMARTTIAAGPDSVAPWYDEEKLLLAAEIILAPLKKTIVYEGKLVPRPRPRLSGEDWMKV